MRAMIQKFRRDAAGTTAMEYGLIGALIAVVIIVAVTDIGRSLNSVFNTVQSHFTSAPAG